MVLETTLPLSGATTAGYTLTTPAANKRVTLRMRLYNTTGTNGTATLQVNGLTTDYFQAPQTSGGVVNYSASPATSFTLAAYDAGQVASGEVVIDGAELGNGFILTKGVVTTQSSARNVSRMGKINITGTGTTNPSNLEDLAFAFSQATDGEIEIWTE